MASARSRSARSLKRTSSDPIECQRPDRLPEFRGIHQRQLDLLPTEAVHFVAKDGLDTRPHALAQRQEREKPGGQWLHEAAAHQQLVAGKLVLRRSVPKGLSKHGAAPHRRLLHSVHRHAKRPSPVDGTKGVLVVPPACGGRSLPHCRPITAAAATIQAWGAL